MDNNRVVVVSEGEQSFALAMRLAFEHAPGGKARCWWEWTPDPKRWEGFKVEGLLGVCAEKFLVLDWEPEKSYGGEARNAKKIALPFDMDVECSIRFALEWLKQQSYNHEPDHDGSNGKGFVVCNESWGHVGDDHYSIVAIGPAWAMYGK